MAGLSQAGSHTMTGLTNSQIYLIKTNQTSMQNELVKGFSEGCIPIEARNKSSLVDFFSLLKQLQIKSMASENTDRKLKMQDPKLQQTETEKLSVIH